MSEKNDAEKFLDQVNTNSQLQGKLQEVGAGFHEVGKAHGFDFTQQQLHEALHKRWSIPKSTGDTSTPDTCFFG